jgi:hypothetical protein
MPLLHCPSCSASVDVPTSRAGSEIQCPSCHTTISVPKLGELRKLESQASPDGKSATSNTGQRTAFALLLTIAAIALVGASYCMVRFAAIEVPATTEEHIAEIELFYSQMPVAQLVGEWREMEDFSPELASPYTYQLIADEKAEWLRSGLIGFAIAALAGVLAFVSLSLGRAKT